MASNPAVNAVRSWASDLVPARGPARRLAVLTVVQATGFGLFLSSSAIFFRSTIGLSAGQVGFGLSAAGLAGMLFTVPIGRLADRFGPRLPLLISYAALAVLFAAYCGVTGFAGFLVLAALISVCETSSHPLRMALTHQVFQEDERVRVSAQMRSVFNVGFMLGAAIAGGALAVGSRTAFYAVALITALAHACCALITWRLPAQEEAKGAGAPKGAQPRSGLRDFRFVSLALLCGVLEFYQPILTVALPLWIITHTEAPSSVNAVLLLLDTVLVIAFQVAASRGAETAPGAARMLRRSGLLLAACCLVFAVTQDIPAVVAVPLLLVGTAVLVLGELSQAAGSWGLSLHLPPEGKQGEYQGVFALGRGLQQTAGPFLVTALAVGQGRLGWMILAAVLLLAGLACPPLTRSAEAAKAKAASAAEGRNTAEPEPAR
ncbi:MFS transporter [Streptomyces sp. NBC_00620]|uniref:MFS transporter n=1 Tax=Streptomyces sp. NBC_00620 TaxID=2903666 RepID=UPI002253B49B|nr:MFS transporter [Streptomyces sp. NBC_00620]MCX4976600.1 MFS transporter [Streptomyces sp. NBC_00620]